MKKVLRELGLMGAFFFPAILFIGIMMNSSDIRLPLGLLPGMDRNMEVILFIGWSDIATVMLLLIPVYACIKIYEVFIQP